MTLRQLITKSVAWLIKHPWAITVGGGPIITRAKVRTSYNSAHPSLNFDADLMAHMRSLDNSISADDEELQGQIDETVPEDEDITTEINTELAGDPD